MKPLVKIAMFLVIPWVSGCSFDLFHDTSWKTACDIDPETPGCEDLDAGDASSDADAGGEGM
jgi:hypothetical protein